MTFSDSLVYFDPLLVPIKHKRQTFHERAQYLLYSKLLLHTVNF